MPSNSAVSLGLSSIKSLADGRGLGFIACMDTLLTRAEFVADWHELGAYNLEPVAEISRLQRAGLIAPEHLAAMDCQRFLLHWLLGLPRRRLREQVADISALPVTKITPAHGHDALPLLIGNESFGTAVLQLILDKSCAEAVQRVEAISPYRASIVVRRPRHLADVEYVFGERRACPVAVVHQLDGEAFRQIHRRFADARARGRAIEVVQIQGMKAIETK